MLQEFMDQISIRNSQIEESCKQRKLGNHWGLAWHWVGSGRGVCIRENLLGEELVEPRLVPEANSSMS